MMYHIALWINIITFAKVICVILASTHWIVTDEGFIQPILDSPFHLKVPNDLVSFLEQENRLSDIHAIYQHFLERKSILEHSLIYSLNEAQVVQQKYKNNENCVKTKNKKFKDVDLSIPFTSDGSEREGVYMKDFFPKQSENSLEGGFDEPDCHTLYNLPFSMSTFEHLEGMKERHNLSIPLEPELREWLIPETSVSSFGLMMDQVLQQNISSWLHYNLASMYWRIKGNALNALECSRRAVYFSPRKHRDVTLLNLGLIFYRAKRYLDAAVVFHAAVDHAPFAAINHYALANAYANIAEFEKSAACYKNVVNLRPSYDVAVLNQNMMLCYAFRVMEILDIHNAIQEMRSAFEEYQGIFSKWQATGIKALNLQSSLSLKIIDNPNIVFSNRDSLTKHSFTSAMADKKIFRYSLLQNHDMFSNDLFGMLQASSNLYKTVDSFQNQINEISNNYELSDNYLLVKKSQNDLPPVIDVSQLDKSTGFKAKSNADEWSIITSYFHAYFQRALERKPIVGKSVNEKDKILNIKYPKDTMKVSRMKCEFDKNNDWPSMKECELWKADNSKLTDLSGNEKPFPVYLPVENKGYDVRKILSDYIRTGINVEHSLPWHPPTCPSKPLGNINYLPEGIKVKAKLLPQLPDDESLLHDILIMSIHEDLESGKQHQEAEIGHRIHMAIKLKVAPKWVLYTLGSLYWRVRKNVPNTIDCLVNAIEEVPKDLKDVPLTSLASVLFELGYVDNAFKLANEAHYVNLFEPATNFLLSLIHKKNNHIIGQLYHIRQVIRVDEDFLFGKAYQLLKAWSCHTKFSIRLEEDETPSATEKVEGSNVHVLSKEGVILSMLCSTTQDGQSCHPSNVFVYETENEGRVVREDGVIPLLIAEEKSLSKVYSSTVDLFTKAAFRINLMFEDTLFKITVPLMQLVESTVETKDGKVLFKSDVTSSNTYVIDKNRRQKDLGKFSILFNPNSDADWSDGIFEWFVNDKQVLFHTSNELCSKVKSMDNLLSSKQIWNLFLERFPTLNQILTPFDTTGSLEPHCIVSESLTPDSDMLGWYMKKPNNPSDVSSEKILKLLRKLMGGTTAPLDALGTMIAEAMSDHEESWVLKVLAGIYYSVKGNSLTAITCMKQALTLAPEHDKDVPLLGLAALSYWVNSIHDAIVYAKFAYEIRPNFPAGPFFIGFILTFAKREKEAFLMLHKAYTIDMDLSVIEDIIKYIVCKHERNFKSFLGDTVH